MQTKDRLKAIKAKGFAMSVQDEHSELIKLQNTGYQFPNVDFNKMKVGIKTLEDAVLKISDFKKANSRLGDKATVLQAITNLDYITMREISNFYYRVSGIYARILRYMARIYCYDWFVTPYVNDDKAKQEKVLDGFFKCLNTLDNFHAKKVLGEIALKVMRNGVYYGYKVKGTNGQTVLQELDPNYCRSRYNYGDKPAVEFNMKYFDDMFRDTTQRSRILKMFPEEFAKGYKLYKAGKLVAETIGEQQGWYLLDPKMTVKFNANAEDYPMFISVIPLIIDLNEAQALDRKKTMQRLLKIVIQKMPLDKNGDLVFDVEEAQQLHNNAVQMLSRAIGVDVLTTFADVAVESMVDSKSDNQTDDLERVERQIFNDVSSSKMLFNPEGNLALEKSILNDESNMYDLVLQFEAFLNELLDPMNTNRKKIEYRVQILKTTVYNYKEMAKLFKEEVTLGYSKMLPQIALGQSQSSVLANAYFENDILDLVNVFIPPLMSSTMNQQMVQQRKSGSGSANKNEASTNENGAGRPPKEDDQKSEKTIKNLESQS